MRNLWLVWVWIAALFVLNVAARAHRIDFNDPHDPYYQISEVRSEAVSLTTEPITPEKLEQARQNFHRYIQLQQQEMYEIDHSFARTMAVNPYVIAQILFKVWDIILASKPVVNIEVKNASALPVMADYNWAKLTGWRPERVVKNKLVVRNLLGMHPITMDYAIKLMFGGSVKGRGMYIASARVIPSDVVVLGGYDLDVSVNVPDVINISGREDDPIAQITLEITHKIRSRLGNWVIKKSELKDVYKVQGDGLVLDYKNGIEHFGAVYHPPAPPLPSPTATPEPVLPTDPFSDPMDDPFAEPTPTPSSQKPSKSASPNKSAKPAIKVPTKKIRWMKVRTARDQVRKDQ